METPSLERLPAKAKEDTSPHEIRLSPAGHQPSIFWSHAVVVIVLLILVLLLISFLLFQLLFEFLSRAAYCSYEVS